MSGVQTVAGLTLAVTASQPATQDSAGYGALSYDDVGEITTIGEYGKQFNLVTHNPIADPKTNKFKGSYDNGSLSMELAIDTADTGQGILDAAVDSNSDYTFRVTRQDGEIDYFQGKIMSKTVNAGGVDEILTSSINLEITTDIVQA